VSVSTNGEAAAVVRAPRVVDPILPYSEVTHAINLIRQVNTGGRITAILRVTYEQMRSRKEFEMDLGLVKLFMSVGFYIGILGALLYDNFIL